ncbi:MAG: SDR family NAD(P)-dependent oxidoreductase [Rhodospirillales bacterium]|nr:SDR family NAD(P)-dependent oxidoreductase [Rhodospirillales bacterium]MBO6786246.1 SDR family NAD(P)-dependent oxidoreductase [Rhodospirillales bacterium]
MVQESYHSILITGASSGIGRALALELAGPGVLLAITGRDAARLSNVERELRDRGAEVIARTIDVTDRQSMSQLVADMEQHTPIDLAVANAGISSGAGAGSGDDDMTRDVFAVNLAGVLNTILPALVPMRSRHSGHVAIVSSVAGFRGLPSAPAYSASKVAVKAWGEAIRPELEHDGISLSLIYPGFVESRITDKNKFRMPFLMPTEKAGQIVARGLARRKKTIAFPWQMVWLMKALAALPSPIFYAIMRRAPRKDD